MGTKIFGIIASAAIVVVIALTLINFGNYRSLLPERTEPTAAVEATVEIEATEVDTMATEAIDSLAIAEPADTLQLEQEQ
ncbi:MAG: hypothetical protein IKB68_04655 [Rikenellaceae bacterium]|nr:hypothetical protein [Rikenellaceae bacterium]MBR2501745.1 hypothetical protein [Rikenellaceae bacterium]